ncbi:lipase family protein [Marinomonas fungiae]|uniref:lipase family protein n=1 Tax=Marinomonas fungiae TaxID=1137284 RepID=UPI003A94CF36
MDTISPNVAASLADEVYGVIDNFSLSTFLGREEFSSERENTAHLHADVGSRLIQVSDGFGVCARGAGNYKDDAFIIFRGTTSRNYGADWLTDTYCGVNISEGGTLVHAGFNQVFASMLSDISSFFGRQQGIQQVHCIGHSLGGAIANLAADWIKNALGKPVSLYTFGAPRVGWGNSGFARSLTEKLGDRIYRVHHRTDPVTMVPVYPFCHAPTSGQSYYINFGGLVINPSAHKMANYITSVSEIKWSKLQQSMPGFTQSIRSWLDSDFNENINSSIFWEKLNNALAYVIQKTLSVAQVTATAGFTVIDYLTMVLHKGISMVTEGVNDALLLIQKIMRALGMKVAETAQELTQQMIKLVLTRLLSKLYNEARRALKDLTD